jgi:type III secretion system chaperone SycN
MNINHAVADFGRSLGMDCNLDEEGVLSIELANGDVLSLEQSGDDLLVYRLAHFPYISAAQCMQAIKLCNARLQEGLGWQLQVGLHGSGADSALVFLYRLSGSRISARGIEQAIAMIEAFQQR